ncbi:LacI family transcriptional regulator [Rhizobium deserti]|uniref:LacI family transcriptional regulator n=1 Tax=Rhizobium deserti TaxID=2547961 RepID=A0A4R5UP01_9HYPH|nr:LacI family DNA-binding transcriptional regulator [Rhizobium deserti]TDK39549.1 LacI family transcriptional regulator [Rhizobium deserti]
MAVVRQSTNMSAIALALGVSAATVSNALSGKGRVSPELVDKIRAKAAELGYVPSLTARALRTGRTGVLGLVLPDIANPLFPQIAQAIENAAASAGYGVLIADSRGNNNTQTLAIQRLMERQVDGMVIVPRFGTRIADLGCPVAVIDSPSTPGNTVSADHWQGGQLVAEHLVGLGHRNFVLIGANPQSNVQNDRIGGMKSRMPKDARIEVIWIEKAEALAGPGCALGLADRIERGFTAFAASNDLHALRALTELQRAGVRIPDQASIVGFDDLVWSSVVSPSITTVRQNMSVIAEIAVSALLGVIDQESPETADVGGMAVAQRDRVPMTLIARQTSAAVNPHHETLSLHARTLQKIPAGELKS